MTAICCGSRDWKDKKKIRLTLKLFLWSLKRVVHGGANGADKLSGREAKKLGYDVGEYKAKWTKYGKAAGPIRNQEMLDKEQPDFVIAFHENIRKSKGTKDMIRRARKAGIIVFLVE